MPWAIRWYRVHYCADVRNLKIMSKLFEEVVDV